MARHGPRPTPASPEKFSEKPPYHRPDCPAASMTIEAECQCEYSATPASEDTVELREELAEFRLASARVATASLFELDNAMDAADTASRAVQVLFARLRSENERQAEALEMFRDEQKRDKANLLTPAEAQIVLNRLQDKPSPQIPRAVLWDAMEKLRRRSLSTTGEIE